MRKIFVCTLVMFVRLNSLCILSKSGLWLFLWMICVLKWSHFDVCGFPADEDSFSMLATSAVEKNAALNNLHAAANSATPAAAAGTGTGLGTGVEGSAFGIDERDESNFVKQPHKSHPPRFHEHKMMKKIFLSNHSITCNDGSSAGYYIRKSYGSKKWIVFLEGGWYCFDNNSCTNRWNRMKNLMSSKMWPETRNVGGILSLDSYENPHWWNATHVFVPYCSSDTWSGASFANTTGSFSFLGSLIIEEVIKDLLPLGLMEARSLLLAGSSAGGTGVLLNVDRVSDYLKSVGSKAHVRGISDSGWFIDNEPFAPLDCTDSHTCSPVEGIKLGFQLWNGQVPDRCGQQQNPTEKWKCYFGYRIYPTLRAPLFVFQWLFDEAQLMANNVGAPMTKAQWDYIHQVGDHLRQTLSNVTAVFSPSCISHVILTKRDWRSVQVNQISLPEALHCWEHEIVDAKGKLPKRYLQHRFHHRHIHSETYMLSDSPEDYRYHHYNRATASSSQTPTTAVWPESNETILISEANQNGSRTKQNRRKRKKNKKRNKRRHKKGRKIRPERSFIFDELKEFWDETTNSPSSCQLKLLDECTWPQCNRACPKLFNPFTGEEMDFIELLKSFGLDMSSVAMALGLDMDALNAMGNDQLLHILTQNSKK